MSHKSDHMLHYNAQSREQIAHTRLDAVLPRLDAKQVRPGAGQMRLHAMLPRLHAEQVRIDAVLPRPRAGQVRLDAEQMRLNAQTQISIAHHLSTMAPCSLPLA